MRRSSLAAAVLLWCTASVFAQEATTTWTPYFGDGKWTMTDDVLRVRVDVGHSARLLKTDDMTDVLIEADVRMAESGRGIFGLILRAGEGDNCLGVRFHDWTGALELLRFNNNEPKLVGEPSEKVPFYPSHWYHLKAAAIGETVLAKWWPVGNDEPDWQFVSHNVSAKPGKVGVFAMDDTTAEFRNVTVRAGNELTELSQVVARKNARYNEQLSASLTMKVEPMPFVLRDDKGPLRRVDVHLTIDNKPAPAGGKLTYTYGDETHELQVSPSDLIAGAEQLFLPEPTKPTLLKIVFKSDIGKTLEAKIMLKPVRQWQFYMTEHTHYDIGFTAPQKAVMDLLSRDMEKIVPFIKQTADWPEESRFKWTVEVSGLMTNYLERHSRAELEPLLALIRKGSVEVCGVYLNLACELTGHEELIRSVYEAQRLRDAYGIEIDTVMIDDVPGYSWALPEILTEAGMPRVSFRGNSIRGNFLWYRKDAMPRPCWWEGPDGSRVLFWYTDSYREGNFWRNPGLQEDKFLGHIRRNESANATSNHIQMRMGGDNLPPDLDVSINCRDWNKKYLWPKVRVATNREFLDALERDYGKTMPVVRGDIPSWWAEGPGSSAKETGMNRLVHDQAVDVEGLWTLANLTDRNRKYPHPAIYDVYDNMMHFDEHTWGSSQASKNPRHETAIYQWSVKSRFATNAKSLTDDLEHHALKMLSLNIKAPDNKKDTFAVINTLAWKRTDVVELSTDAFGSANVSRLEVMDVRTGKSVPSQVSSDGKTLTFIANDVPSMGYALYKIRVGMASIRVSSSLLSGTKNNHYALSADDKGAIVSCVDQQSGRELFDRKVGLLPNHAVLEKLNADRDKVRSKTPLNNDRIAAFLSSMPSTKGGAVYSDVTSETSLPHCPRIRQTVRLYKDLKLVEWINEVVKEESFEREGLYFAFPFDVPNPTFHLSIADAEMRAGIDQVKYSCEDFYAVQQYIDVEGDDFGIVFVPVDAPNVTLSDFNAYKWADKIPFDRGHVYSMAFNNYWFTNFRAGQEGNLKFRYRMTSYEGERDPVLATKFSWQAFRPLRVVSLDQEVPGDHPLLPESFLQLEGDPVIVSCVKLAEKSDAVIVRLLEVAGKATTSTLKFDLPGSLHIVEAQEADVLERPQQKLKTKGDAVMVQLRPREIKTVRIVVAER